MHLPHLSEVQSQGTLRKDQLHKGALRSAHTTIVLVVFTLRSFPGALHAGHCAEVIKLRTKLCIHEPSEGTLETPHTLQLGNDAFAVRVLTRARQFARALQDCSPTPRLGVTLAVDGILVQPGHEPL